MQTSPVPVFTLLLFLPWMAIQAADPSQGLLCERWDGISGQRVVDLTGSQAFRAAADAVAIVSAAEAPTNQGDLYGQRLSGWVMPPVTGDYTFWIAADDGGELWLSLDGTAAAKQLVASVPGWTPVRAFDAHPLQRSAPIRLTAGRRCYIEALQKEHTGADHLSLAWTVPGQARAIIPASHLIPVLPPPTLAGPAVFAGSAVITLAHMDPLAVVHYTLDGSLPTAAAPVAREPVTLTSSTVVKAMARWPDGRASRVVERAFARMGTGTGLNGSYYLGQNFASGPVATGVDATVDFRWAAGEPPRAGLPATAWSARWLGWIEPRFTEDCTLIVRSDDGARVWLDGVLVMDGWRARGVTEDRAVFAAVAGQRRFIRVEYFQERGAMEMHLRWRSAHEADAVVPSTQLHPLQGIALDIPGQSPVSPVCVEGINQPGIIPLLTAAGVPVPLRICSGIEFHADVPLLASGTTMVTARGGGQQLARAIAWTPTPVAGMAETTLRLGDSLKLLFPTAGTWRIDHQYDLGAETTMVAGAQCIKRFTVPGVSIVTAWDASGNETGRLAVTVVTATFPARVACEVGFTRGLDVAASATNVAYTVTDPTAVQAAILGYAGGIARLSLACRHRGAATLMARLPGGPRAPIIASLPLELFALEVKGRSGIVVDEGSHIGADRLVMRPFVPGLDLSFNMFAHGATFAGGTFAMAFPSDALSRMADPLSGEVMGSAFFDIEMAPGESRYCYRLKVFQAGRDVESLNDQLINGTTCRLEVDKVYFPFGVAGNKPLTIRCTEKGKNHHDHPVSVLGANAPTIAPAGYKVACPDPVGVKNPPVVVNPLPAVVTVATTPVGKYTVDIDNTQFAEKVIVWDLRLATTGNDNVAENTILYIAPAPTMPPMTVRLIPENLEGNADWTARFNYQRYAGGEDLYHPAQNPQPAANPWDVIASMAGAFRGGDVRYTVVYQGDTKVKNILVKGRNPARNVAEPFLTNLNPPPYASAIITHESAWRQFNQGTRTFNEEPNFGAPNGWGMGQLDPPPGKQELWNWQANLTEAAARMNAYQREADAWLARQIAQQMRDARNTVIDNVLFPFGGVNYRQGTARLPAHALGIQRYNGVVGGWCIYWDNANLRWAKRDAGYVNTISAIWGAP